MEVSTHDVHWLSGVVFGRESTTYGSLGGEPPPEPSPCHRIYLDITTTRLGPSFLLCFTDPTDSRAAVWIQGVCEPVALALSPHFRIWCTVVVSSAPQCCARRRDPRGET